LPAVFGSDAEAQNTLVHRLREACETYGFFEMTGHGVPQSLLDEALEQSRQFFDLPIDIKEKYDKSMLV
jgi:isopenicillin N synthase-like dioxygenase